MYYSQTIPMWNHKKLLQVKQISNYGLLRLILLGFQRSVGFGNWRVSTYNDQLYEKLGRSSTCLLPSVLFLVYYFPQKRLLNILVQIR